jgi:hypothetical protein
VGRPCVAPKIKPGSGRADLLFKNDWITEFPDAQPKKQSKPERMDFFPAIMTLRFQTPNIVPSIPSNGNLS